MTNREWQKNQQLKALMSDRLGISNKLIARVEEWANVYFVVIKGRRPRFISKKVNGELAKRHGCKLVNLAGNEYELVSKDGKNFLGTILTYAGHDFVRYQLPNDIADEWRNRKHIDEAIADMLDEYAANLRLSILGF
ncbi:MAG: hypothetical protein ACRC06_06195 [Waterburya sp.]